MAKIVLGVTGSIAAHKSASLVSALSKLNHEIYPVLTNEAEKFITTQTLITLAEKSTPNIYLKSTAHIDLADIADVIVIAPATANTLAKIACGIADNLLTELVLATSAPVILAPAMNSGMWLNPIMQNNMQKLKDFGYIVIEPETGILACGTEGIGKLANIETILAQIIEVISKQ